MTPVRSALAEEQKDVRTVRPEIGKPIQAALDLLKRKRSKDALAQVRDADNVPDKTAYEAYLVERVRAQAEAAAGHAAAAARAFEVTAASSTVTAAERLQFLAAAAGQYYVARDYAKASDLCARYFKGGGTDNAIRTLYIQALYLGNDFAAAGRELLSRIQSEEQAGRTPAEDQLQMLANVHLKNGDKAAYAKVLEQLVAYHPKKEYWLAAIYGVGTRQDFSTRLALDFARIKLATGTMRTATEYLEAAQLSIQTGMPVEAKEIIKQGYAAGLLGTGAEAERHQRLKDMADRNLAEDIKTLGQDDAQVAASKDGTALLNAGFNYVLHGNGAKGLEMMVQGLNKGKLKHPDDARLHLGYAYHIAGQNKKAVQMLKTVRGTDGTAALAHLWIIHLGRKP